jgi:hypothetical protein
MSCARQTRLAALPASSAPWGDRRPRVPVARRTAPARIDLDPEHQGLCWSGGAQSALVHAPDVGEELTGCFVRLSSPGPKTSATI